MEEDFESVVRSQLLILKNQMDIIKSYIDKYDEMNLKLKKTITNELISALISRFERNEKIINELSEKIDSLNFKFQENLSKSIRGLKEEISEAELSKAISKIFEEKEIKVSSKALSELKSI
jgi:hypothetical protein